MIADKLDLQSRLGGEALGVLTPLIAQGLGPAGVVEQADGATTQIPAHRLRMADLGQGAGDHNPVEARERAAGFINGRGSWGEMRESLP